MCVYLCLYLYLSLWILSRILTKEVKEGANLLNHQILATSTFSSHIFNKIDAEGNLKFNIAQSWICTLVIKWSELYPIYSRFFFLVRIVFDSGQNYVRKKSGTNSDVIRIRIRKRFWPESEMRIWYEFRCNSGTIS